MFLMDANVDSGFITVFQVLRDVLPLTPSTEEKVLDIVSHIGSDPGPFQTAVHRLCRMWNGEGPYIAGFLMPHEPATTVTFHRKTFSVMRWEDTKEARAGLTRRVWEVVSRSHPEFVVQQTGVVLIFRLRRGANHMDEEIRPVTS